MRRPLPLRPCCERPHCRYRQPGLHVPHGEHGGSAQQLRWDVAVACRTPQCRGRPLGRRRLRQAADLVCSRGVQSSTFPLRAHIASTPRQQPGTITRCVQFLPPPGHRAGKVRTARRAVAPPVWGLPAFVFRPPRAVPQGCPRDSGAPSILRPPICLRIPGTILYRRPGGRKRDPPRTSRR